MASDFSHKNTNRISKNLENILEPGKPYVGLSTQKTIDDILRDNEDLKEWYNQMSMDEVFFDG